MEIRGHCFIDTPKNESSRRTVYISPAMTEILRNHKKVATGKFVFPSITNLDKPMMPSRIYTLFSKVINSIGLKCKLHTLRHTHITQLLENGVNIKTIQDRVGHIQISTTMGYYPLSTLARKHHSIQSYKIEHKKARLRTTEASPL